MTCFPCWPKKSALLSSDNEVFSQRGDILNEVGNDREDLGAPSKSEQVRETGKILLEALEAVAEQIPVPGDGHATLQQAEVLKKRIKNLAMVLVNQLKGKKAEEIEEKLRKDVEQLENDLKYIQSKLDEIASQNAFLVILFRRLNEDKVRGCVERLTNALESFDLARQIASTDALDHLSQQIITFYKQQQTTLEDIRQSTKNVEKRFENMEQNMEFVRAILAEKKYQGEENSSSPRRGVIPVAPDIFFGRDTIVNDFVQMLVSEESSIARICLLGPGGMGKTSIARAVLHHPTVIDHFGEENRVWVPCVKATSVSLLQDTLYDSLGVSLSTGDPLHDIIQELKSSQSPIILVLDNFETPWNVRGKQSEVQEILLQLVKLRHVTLFVTMRSFGPPGDGVQWKSLQLEAVEEEASVRIYAEIDSAGSKGPGLSSLLDKIGHMPLAVTLMAKLGQKMGYSPAELLELYKDAGTALLNLGEESQRSMDICIDLSVKSQPMIDSPSAAKLLAILALLPVGTTLNALSRWWARDIPKTAITLGLGTLLDTSLVEKRADTFAVLPVIRSYVLDPKRFPADVRISAIQIACVFLKEHNGSLGESTYVTHKHARSFEETNLQGILLETTIPDPDIIRALLILSEHQSGTRPRMEVAQHALQLSHMTKDHKLHAEALYWNGRNLLGSDCYEDAMEQLRLAREAFLRASELKHAADTLCWIGYLPIFTEGQQNTVNLKNALEEFQSLIDPGGIARCQMWLVNEWDSQSLQTLTDIREYCISHNLLLQQAQCAQRLSGTYDNIGRFEEAKKWGLIALAEWKQLYGWSRYTFGMLGKICISLGEYDKAVEYLMKQLEESKAYGSALEIARTLFLLGRAWMKKGHKEDARGAFTETLKYNEMFQGAWDTSATQRASTFYLARLENNSREPNMEEQEALEMLCLEGDLL
ncbi:hypothetical protein BDP27DRAFT_1366476 [Rhodocollybia butyracea]|uniref:Novel STAND NTPase 1 domain-containing protein n=1 Tax=Rhodocollybia butyracea TaxID=206335 RepID=A0A9P5PK39_9AGAR|nr:hypothetical protein BDP27DRAFT_1366476 [Rhodocollybia butyracea]